MESFHAARLILGAIIVLIAVFAIFRRVDVRLVLFVAALALAGLAQNPMAVVKVFFATFANERFVVPICCAMGFAYTLRHTGCDQHLVHLLVQPLTHVRFLLVPGTIVVGFIVNIPIISQTSTVASLGPVVIPILTAARLKPATIGAVLLLGCSIGGELLNPGAPELRTIVEESSKLLNKKVGALNITEHNVVQTILPLDLLALLTATAIFWYMSRREESKGTEESSTALENAAQVDDFQVNYLKALIPFVPLVLLFLTGPPLSLVRVPMDWLVNMPAGDVPSTLTGLYNSRLIGLAMLIGVIVAAAVSGREALQAPKKFFEGAGYAFANIVSLIVTARCFGEGIKQIGLAKLLGDLMQMFPFLLIPAGGAMATFFGALSGSGMATTQSLFEFFARPAVAQDVDPTLVGAVVALASAAGRTMSPVAAVCLMSANLTNTSPFDLAKRVVIPLLGGVVVVIVVAYIMAMM